MNKQSFIVRIPKGVDEQFREEVKNKEQQFNLTFEEAMEIWLAEKNNKNGITWSQMVTKYDIMKEILSDDVKVQRKFFVDSELLLEFKRESVSSNKSYTQTAKEAILLWLVKQMEGENEL